MNTPHTKEITGTLLVCALIILSQGCSQTQACVDEMGNQTLCEVEDMPMDIGLDVGPADVDMPEDLNTMIQDDGILDADVSDLTGDTNDADTDLADMCVPEAQDVVCQGTCGLITDECGNAVQCPPCVCDDTEVSKTRCGQCDLGVLKCDDPQNTNETSCQYDVTGVFEPLTCSQIIYVDASAQGGDGTATNPFTSYNAALARFNAEDTGAIVLSAGVYGEELIIQEGVHVVGGYERLPDGWLQSSDTRVEFKPPQKPAKPVFGLIARDVNASTTVHGIYVEAPDATTEQTSYGAYLVDAPGVVLSSMTILAGRGGDGIAGQPGTKGADGGDGEPPFCQENIDRYQSLVDLPLGGYGGENTDCLLANGGRGGEGAQNDQAGAYPARKGADSADGLSLGGEGGLSARLTRNEGKNGQDAMVPAVGEHGDGGTDAGIINNDLWMIDGAGLAGDDGRHGSGGGGGGGAGGQTSSPWMMGGGGGGAGGCGGVGGEGGTGGGASFGALLIRSNATFVKTNLIASSGGIGGEGAAGGAGGDRGVGHPGSFVTCQTSRATRTWSSGKGGDGANGSHGGQGGGGSGGASYGAYCFDSTISITSTQFQAGTSALGGDGGKRGDAGVTENQWRCY